MKYIIESEGILFWILDKGLCRIMAVDYEDKYEYRGKWYNQIGDSHSACLGKSSLQEYVSNYDFTKSYEEAMVFLVGRREKPITTEQMQHLNSNPDFKY